MRRGISETGGAEGAGRVVVEFDLRMRSRQRVAVIHKKSSMINNRTVMTPTTMNPMKMRVNIWSTVSSMMCSSFSNLLCFCSPFNRDSRIQMRGYVLLRQLW
ncbi:hypothetical protein M758_11G112100 [Ceratodon purpureus]|nr:hypothetical protein M758_11G112100 [Ceratodon purpureus]